MFLHAVDRHVTVTGDADLAAELAPVLTAAVDAHRTAPATASALTRSRLLRQGAAGYALTWMDARVDGVPVTQRAGKPVELNALWINALAALVRLRERVGLESWHVHRLHADAVRAFAQRFPAGDRLADVIDGPGGDDRSLRPNQLLAYSLPYAPLTPDPVGPDRPPPLCSPRSGSGRWPRTTPPTPSRHRGGPAERDRAYHQGTVWPWLLGPVRRRLPTRRSPQ